MGSLLQRLEEREAAARGRVEQLRAEIASLSAELAVVQEMLSRLAITRETVLSVLAGEDEDPGVAVAAAPPVTVGADDALAGAAQRQVLDVFASAAGPLRAGQVCQALRVGTQHRQVEGMRHRLKRLVGQGVLAEPQPAMFVMAGAAGTAEPATTEKDHQ